MCVIKIRSAGVQPFSALRDTEVFGNRLLLGRIFYLFYPTDSGSNKLICF
jgi:hypothetical protein